MNEIELKEQFDLVFAPDDIELLKKFDELEKRVKVMKDSRNEQIKEFMLKNNLTDYEQDGVKFTYIKPSKRLQVDTAKLQEEGIYNLFTKETDVKDSVRISISYED